MRKLIITSLAAAAVLFGSGRLRAEVIIDTFNVTTQSLSVSGAPSGLKTAFDSALTAAGEAIGGERDIFLSRTPPSTMGTVGADVGFSIDGAITYSSGGATTGKAEVVWDGIDGVVGIDSAAGLGGVDLTSGGSSFGLGFATTSDLGNSLTFTIYSSATDFSTFTYAVPVSGVFTPTFIPFSAFVVGGGAGATFTSVTAIVMLIDGTANPSADFSMDFLAAVAPEPSSMALLGIGLATLAGARLRRLRRKQA